MDQRPDQRPDRRRDGLTHPLIETRQRILEVLPTDGQAKGLTDGRTDPRSYRDVRTHLKIPIVENKVINKVRILNTNLTCLKKYHLQNL